MSHQRTPPVESICTLLTCTSDEFLEFYNNDRLETSILSDEVLKNVIDQHRASLRAAHDRCRLDVLLFAMLEHAPEPSGQRYVAVALHIAHRKGVEAVIDLARAWLEHLFLPMMSCSMATRTDPSGSATPTIEPDTRSKQSELRAEVAARESYRCAITGAFDAARAKSLIRSSQAQAIPPGPRHRMEAAHIIPFALNDFGEITPEITNAARTWDMLKSWTQIDIQELAGQGIDSPANAIYMTSGDHYSFRQFLFYLDKEAFPDNPNRYMARMARQWFSLSDGHYSSEVEFQTLAQPSVEPPNPKFLKVHAAFARVLSISGTAEYCEQLEMDAECNAALPLDGKIDIGSILAFRLAALMAY